MPLPHARPGLRPAVLFAVLAFSAGCSSGSSNPSLDDYSDGVLSFVTGWLEEAEHGTAPAGAYAERCVTSGVGTVTDASRWDLGAVSVAEGRGAPPGRPGERFDAALARYLAERFQRIGRHEVRVVGFAREGTARRAVLRPYFEGVGPDGSARLETGHWDARLEPGDGGWRFTSLVQSSWRSVTCVRPLFSDGTAASGLADAVHEAARAMAARNIPLPGEHLPPGTAILDADGDGREDVFLCGGQGSRLFLNRGGGTFVEATEAAGVRGHVGREAVGALAFDYDNDGRQDLYVTYFDGPNLLFRGRGDGTFEEVGGEAGAALLDWCTSAAALDYDRDGFADLYVLVYGRPERGPGIAADNAGPNHLFHNNGDGTFTEVTRQSGSGHTGWGLALASFDADEDGWPDVYVANDFGPNVLYRNRRDGTFEDVARAAGVRDDGFGMGVAVADADGDGHLDLYVSNYSLPERWFLRDPRFPMPSFPYSLGRPVATRRLARLSRGSSLFLFRGPLRFERVPDEAGVWDTSWSWGTVFVDALLRGRPDLFAVNGMVSGKRRTDHEADFWNAMSRGFRELEKHGTPPADFGEDSLWGYLPKRLFLNLDGRRFAEASSVVGLFSEGNQRGLAVLDANGDGAPDLLAAGFLQAPQLWLNRNPEGNRSLVVRLEGEAPARGTPAPRPPRSTRDALGAIVRVEAGGLSRTQVVLAGDSYLSSSSKALFFGLGRAERADRLTVRWPSGRITELTAVPAGRLTLSEAAPAPETRR